MSDAPVSDAPVSDFPWLIVGLGNPGPAYAGNRHNIGYLVLDVLAARMRVRFSSHKTRNEVAEGRVSESPSGAVRLVLAKPRAFMNATGGPAGALRTFYKTPLEQVVVLHDELDLPFGTLRLKCGGGDNGHNGLRSLRASFGSGDFFRVRCGIGRPPGRQDPADYVLRDFGPAERKELPLHLQLAADAVVTLATKGLEKAQRDFNS